MRARTRSATAWILGAPLVLAWCLAAAAADDAAPSSFAYLPVPGPYAVEEIGPLELPDPVRRKVLPVKVYVPRGDGPFPVILYSHGAGESAESAPNMARHWCSHGYISLHPGHVQKQREARRFGLGRLINEFSRIKNLGDATAFGQRVDDLVLILDHLDDLEAQAPALRGKLDRDRIGVAGHSLGAVTAVLIGGAQVFEPGRDVVWQFRDPRVDAIISISGAGLDPAVGLTERSWTPIDIPMLVISGSRDPGRGGRHWRTDPYRYAREGDKYLVYIEGAHHASYIRLGTADTYTKEEVGSPESLPSHRRFLRKNLPEFAQEAIFHYTLIATTAFWDAALKDRDDARAFLRSDALNRYSFGAVEVQTK